MPNLSHRQQAYVDEQIQHLQQLKTTYKVNQITGDPLANALLLHVGEANKQLYAICHRHIGWYMAYNKMRFMMELGLNALS